VAVIAERIVSMLLPPRVEPVVCVVTFRAPADEAGGLIGSGFPFYWPGWGANVIGMVLDAQTDWTEVAELLTDSYCVQAPKKLARLVDRPPAHW
jgi:hypothetical protein